MQSASFLIISRNRQIIRRRDLSLVHPVVPSLIAGWKPVVVEFSLRSATCIWKFSQHVFALSEMSCEVWSTREQGPLAVFVTILALESLRSVLFVFVSFQIGSTGTLVAAYVAAEYLLLHVYIGDVLVADCGSGKAFEAFRALVRTVTTMTPYMSLHTVGIAMIAPTAADPTAINFILDVMYQLEVLVQLVSQSKDFITRLSFLISPLATVRESKVSCCHFQ